MITTRDRSDGGEHSRGRHGARQRHEVSTGFAAAAPLLGPGRLAFGLWYAAFAWTVSPYPF